ncbi:MAG: hypothetical protein JWS12_551 [Candidatus Saccharibacteria bacterium]|nr:hypothetical protein [Candidatus Saccharibacteria bacterium]
MSDSTAFAVLAIPFAALAWVCIVKLNKRRTGLSLLLPAAFCEIASALADHQPHSIVLRPASIAAIALGMAVIMWLALDLDHRNRVRDQRRLLRQPVRPSGR